MLRKIISVTVALLMLFSVMSTNVFAQTNSANTKNVFNDFKNSSKKKAGEIIIKYKDKTSTEYKANLEKKVSAKTIKTGKNGSKLIRVDEENFDNELKMLITDKNIEYAVPNYIREANDFPVDDPNDPEFMNQWGLTNTNAKAGWMNLGDTSALQEIKVAVIDTGLDMNHEDLKDAISPDGYDFVDMDNDPSPGPVNEEHATHVAGIIAAAADNSIGVAGVSGKAPVKIMPLRVLEAGRGDDYTISQAITYAVDHGAKVINMSLGSMWESPYFNETVEYALSKNVVVVASAGNNTDETGFYYPASIPGVTTVAASDFMNMRTYFSNYGPEVELTAPGFFVLSTIPGNKYEYFNGTSMAAPFISAASALLLAKNPDLSNIEVEQILTESAQDLGDPGKDKDSGYGLLDLGKALSSNGTKAKIEFLNLLDNSNVCGLLNIQTRFTYPADLLVTDLFIDGTKVDSIVAEQGKMIYTFETDTYMYKDGNHTVKVQATDKSGQIYEKELNITIKNSVSSGLNVKITHNGAPVKAAFVDVWYKHPGSTQENGAGYENIYFYYTGTSGIATIPGTMAPNGNEYLICANYTVIEDGTVRNVVQFKKTTAPGTVTMDEKGLIPVTVDSGLINEDYRIHCNYKVPESDEYIAVALRYDMKAGESKTYLSPGTYCLEGFTQQQDYSDIDPLYILKTGDIRIGDCSNSISFEDRPQNLTKLNLGIKDTPGFVFKSSSISIYYKNMQYVKRIFFDESIKNLDVYMSPGMIKYDANIVGAVGTDNMRFRSIGDKYIREGQADMFFGGNYRAEINLNKSQCLPGEDVELGCNMYDGFGNRVSYAEYINSEYYKAPVNIQLLDKNNVLIEEAGWTIGDSSFALPQNIPEGTCLFRLTGNIPQMVQTDAQINISTATTENAVKLKIKLPENSNAQYVTIDATNLGTGVTKSFYGYNLADGDCYLPLANGDYKLQVEAYDEKYNKAIYFKEIKSPGNYDLSPECLQKVELAVRDEYGNIRSNYAYFMYSQSGTSNPTSNYLQSYGYNELYMQKGLYNFEAVVYSGYDYPNDCVLFRHDVSIGSGGYEKESIDFNCDDVTEVNFGADMNSNNTIPILRDKKSGMVCKLSFNGLKTIMVSNGSYEIDMLSKKQYPIGQYYYVLTSDKDFTGDNVELNVGSDFTVSVKPDKDTYIQNGTIKTENMICDNYNNRLIGIGTKQWSLLTSQQTDAESKNYVMGVRNGKMTLYDIKNKKHIEIDTSFDDIYDPFMYITDSEGNVVISQKSGAFYNDGELKLYANKIKPGNYNVELSIDVGLGGNISAKSGFKVIEE